LTGFSSSGTENRTFQGSDHLVGFDNAPRDVVHLGSEFGRVNILSWDDASQVFFPDVVIAPSYCNNEVSQQFWCFLWVFPEE